MTSKCLTSNIKRRNCVHSTEAIKIFLLDHHSINIIASLPRSLPTSNIYFCQLNHLEDDWSWPCKLEQHPRKWRTGSIPSHMVHALHGSPLLSSVFPGIAGEDYCSFILRVSTFVNGSNISPFYIIALDLCFYSCIPLPHPEVMYLVKTEYATNNQLISKASSYPWIFTSDHH